MGHQVLILGVIVALACVAQGLRCNYCKSISKEHPTCENTEERECSMGLNNCITITMNEPAYGEVRRCAADHECEGKAPHLVDRQCCSTDLCNIPSNS